MSFKNLAAYNTIKESTTYRTDLPFKYIILIITV